jgi:hypothetical protein
MYVEPRYLQLPRGRVSAADLGPVVARVKCTLATSNIAAKGPLRDGDASFVEAGSSVYEVRGYSAACRIAAKQNGKLTLFYATKSGDDRVTATCALNRGQGKH